jgi:predicted NAD/FAD-binding protein
MRIAIIGAGISGLTAAYLLAGDHEIVVFEANDYIGGHTHTVDVTCNGTTYPVDTGFIVFNQKTYPNFIRLMRRLGVPWQPSTMSFSVQCDRTGLEYSPSTFNSLFAQRSNLFRPSFYRMLVDVLRFRKEALELLTIDDHHTPLGQYLKQRGYSQSFIDHFIIPMGGAIWSADPARFQEFPARSFVQFFDNHGFLQLKNQPQWLVIRGGSRSYLEPLTRPYRDGFRLNCPVKTIQRHADRVEVHTRSGETESFDEVILAAHSDQALAMLADPSPAEREILSAIPYQENTTVLHTDTALLPRHRAAWASWNYHIPRQDVGRVAVTYNMNMLQSLAAPVTYCVTLNSPRKIDPSRIVKQLVYHHPVYTTHGIEMQKRHDQISGLNRTHYCGAYWGYGFHEDGVSSALAICKHFGKDL